MLYHSMDTPCTKDGEPSTYAFDALLEDYPADRLHTGREIASDDIAVCLPTGNVTGTLDCIPLTHGNLLHTLFPVTHDERANSMFM